MAKQWFDLALILTIKLACHPKLGGAKYNYLGLKMRADAYGYGAIRKS